MIAPSHRSRELRKVVEIAVKEGLLKRGAEQRIADAYGVSRSRVSYLVRLAAESNTATDLHNEACDP